MAVNFSYNNIKLNTYFCYMIFVLLLHNIYTHCTTCFDINSTSQHNCIYYTQNTKYTNYILNKKHYIVINIYYLINASYIIQQLYLLSYKSIHIFCFTFKYYKWIFLSCEYLISPSLYCFFHIH